MNQAYARQAYENNRVTTAPQKKLIIMLYDGAIKNIKLAKLAMGNKDIEKTNTYLIKAQDIVSEFMNTLNFDLGGQVAKDLYALYDYMYKGLIRANIDRDMDKLEEIERYMEELRSTWMQI